MAEEKLDFAMSCPIPIADYPLVTLAHGGPTHTYAGIGIFHPAFYAGVCPNTPRKLRPLLDAAIPRGEVQGELHTGRWTDVGTPERLAELDRQLHTPISS